MTFSFPRQENGGEPQGAGGKVAVGCGVVGIPVLGPFVVVGVWVMVGSPVGGAVVESKVGAIVVVSTDPPVVVGSAVGHT